MCGVRVSVAWGGVGDVGMGVGEGGTKLDETETRVI